MVPWKRRQAGGLTELLSRTVIREEHTCSSIPLRGLTSRFYFNKVHHGCIRQGLSSTSYVLVSVRSLGLQKWTADMASSLMELFISWGRQTLTQSTCMRCPWPVRIMDRGLEDTVLVQEGDVSPFSSVWEGTESKTKDGQRYMNVPFSFIWEGSLEYSSQHFPPRRAI